MRVIGYDGESDPADAKEIAVVDVGRNAFTSEEGVSPTSKMATTAGSRIADARREPC